jgi:vacuolar protein-sorting-associated protein 4
MLLYILTGKTRLGQALSGEIGSNFYCVSSSDFLSSWVGESEKIIKELFQHARRSSGISVIFIDEVDCICRQRSSREEEHTRRIKTELLRQMEGADTCQDSQMFLLCATNCPWELDTAFIRRFQKRIYVPLPSRDVRLDLLKMFFANIPSSLTEMEFNLLANKMEGYTGSDISIFCSDAAMMPVRELENSTHWKLSTAGQCYRACSPTDPNGKMMKFTDIPPNQVCTRQITLEDCLKSLQHNHMTVTSEDLKHFAEFTQRCGQIG